jgi:phospholipase/carboxylesterase
MSELLRYELAAPERVSDGANVIVLLHGRGADRFDLLGLRKRFPDNWFVVTPEAPFAAAPWGYGPGWAWYRFLGRNRPEEESLNTSLERLHELLDAMPKIVGVEPARVALGGFSQGGTLSMAYALSHVDGPSHILNFSGFLADHPRVNVTPASVKGYRFFWAHGTQDPNIPFDLAIEGRSILRKSQADLTAHDYNIGHWIDAQELIDANDWLLG